MERRWTTMAQVELLAHCRLKAWPEDLPLNVISLILDFHSISTIPATISKYQQLETLKIGYNGISSLPSEIAELKKLTRLYLYGNCLPDVPSCVFQLSSLSCLDLGSNQIRQLPDNLGSLRCLDKLILNGNHFTSLPDSICDIKCLHTLNISDNEQLTSLPLAFGKLSRLYDLDLSYTGLTSLPHSFSQLASIGIFQASYTPLENLPETFASAYCIKVIDVENGQLRSLPSWLSHTHHLKTINLNGNKLNGETLPHDFGLDQSTSRSAYDDPKLWYILDPVERAKIWNELPVGFNGWSLVELTLCNNHITELPACVGGLKSLATLELTENSLSALPESFCQLYSLTDCFLSNNDLKCLPDAFGELRYLRDLRLAANSLSSLPTTFSQLSNLDCLDLRSNEFSQYPEIVKELTQLQCLDLTENKLETDNPVYLEDGWPKKKSKRRSTKSRPMVGSGDPRDEIASDDCTDEWNSECDGSEHSTESEEQFLTYEDLDDETEDWAADLVSNPYDTPMPYEYPSEQQGCLPAALHRPSHQSLFLNKRQQAPPVVDGQFDDAN